MFERTNGSWKNKIISVFSFSRSEWASYCFSIRMSKLLWVRNPLANHPHQPRPIQIQGMPIGYCRKQNDCQKVEKSTGQSASPSLERLPRSSPTTQPSQWWGTSIKYLKNEEQTKKKQSWSFSHLRLSPPFVYTGRPFSKLVWLEGGTRLN